MHAVSPVLINQSEACDKSGLHPGDVQQALREQTKRRREHMNVAVRRTLWDKVRHSDKHALLKKLIIFQIRRRLAGDCLCDELRHRAHHIIFRDGQHAIPLLQQHKHHCRRKAQQLFHAVHIDEGHRAKSAFLNLFTNRKRIACPGLQHRILAGPVKYPLLSNVRDGFAHQFLGERSGNLRYFQHLKRLHLDSELATHAVALKLGAVQQHIPITHRTNAGRTQRARSMGRVGKRLDLFDWSGGCDDAVDELIAIMHRRECGTNRRCSRLIRRSDEMSVFHPAAKPPQQHRKVAKMIGYTNHRMRRHPSRHAEDDAVQLPLLERLNGTIRRLILCVVHHHARVQNASVFERRKRSFRVVMLDCEPFKRRIHLSKTNKPDLFHRAASS
ncbi:hypothetical protein SDC9_86182 [bioreactor metagenome]|uniref:Uncharacterized protein n=1 Tax=bioreactor metagenome TaxID=1076179 RepID=A0A644ZGV7_9ZZZZ